MPQARGLPTQPAGDRPSVAMFSNANDWPAPSRAQAFAAARRHSRLVRLLRVVLPACAVGVGALYLVSSRLQVSLGDFQASVGHVQVSRDALRMVNPRIEGTNRTNGAYVVTADYAEQNIASPAVVQLSGVKAALNDPKEGWSRLSAPQGTFDSKQEHLTLFGGIEIASSSGMVGRLVAASIDMKRQTIVSQQPVAFEFLNGDVQALGMEIAMDQRAVLFTGKVRVTLRKRSGGETGKPQ